MIRVRPDIRKQKVGNDLMLFDERDSRVHVLNETSAFVWDRLAEGCDPSAIASKLADAFDTAGRDVQAAVQKSLSLFRERGLLDENPGS